MPQASLQTFFFFFLNNKNIIVGINPPPLKAKAATLFCAHEASGGMSRINQQEMRGGGFSDRRKACITVALRVGGGSEGEERPAAEANARSHRGESEI